MKQCFGYIRVSTPKQGEGVSLQEQMDDIRVFASRHNLEVIDWFEEQQTAAKSGRPVFNRMLKQLQRGQASGLIMHKIDRSARNLRDWSIVTELPDQGIDVYVATESLDFTTRGGRLTADMLAVIAADYIRNLRDETKKGIRGRLKQGLYPGRAPLGYLNNGKGLPKTPCPEKAPLILEAYKLYDTRQYSLRSLLQAMTDRGLRNLNGHPLSLHGLETILKNPFYAGIIEVKRTGETFQGIHDPIVPMALWQRLQDLKAGRCGPKRTRHNHLFRGLFRCGLCARPMSPERQKGSVYYRCQEPSCQTKTVREDVLEDAICRALASYELTPESASKLARRWNTEQAKLTDANRKTSLELRIATTEQHLSRAADLLIANTLDEAVYLEKKREANLLLAALREELQKLPDPADIAADHAEVIELMKSLMRLYQMLNPDEKRVFIENTLSNRTIVGKQPCFEPSPWVRHVKNGSYVSFGDPSRHTDRTFRPPEAIKRLFEQYSEDLEKD